MAIILDDIGHFVRYPNGLATLPKARVSALTAVHFRPKARANRISLHVSSSPAKETTGKGRWHVVSERSVVMHRIISIRAWRFHQTQITHSMNSMNSIVYIVGAVVIIVVILKALGLF